MVSAYVLFHFVSFKASNMYLNESVHKTGRKHTGSQRSGTKGRWIWRLLGEQEVVRVLALVGDVKVGE